MNRRQCLGFFSVLPVAPAVGIVNNDGVRAFIVYMRDKHQFSEDELERFLSQLSINDKVLSLSGGKLSQSPKKVYWREYRKRRLTAKNIAAGKRFWRIHAESLQKAEKTYGVSAAVIVAIIGVETRYGEYLGNFSVAEALVTLAFAHPTRAAEFRSELEHFLLYVREQGKDPLTINGSYAGAFGVPQFLPSSLRRFAVDFDEDGKINLFDMTDAIGSIGNFLYQHGWRRNMGISYLARIAGDASAIVELVADNDYKAVFTTNQLAEMGVIFSASVTEQEEPYLVVDLENLYDTEYRVGTGNFYALTRYNRSFKYAAVVADLAAALLNGE